MKKILLTLFLLFPAMAHGGDFSDCVDSYEGMVSYEFAKWGCAVDILPELSDEQREAFFENDYCTPDMPAYSKPWIQEGLTPCDWAGYECTDFDDCLKCNVAVANCEI